MQTRLFLILTCLAYFPGSGQQAVTVSRIDSVLAHYQWVAEIPGMAAGVIVNGKEIFRKTYGVAALSSHLPVKDNSDFHMASVSKPFAAMAMLQLASQGAFHLDSPLVRIVPDFRMKDKRYRLITLRHILTHSSGIPDVEDYEWYKPQYDDSSALRYLQQVAQLQLEFDPGSRYRYSNTAFNLLAAVVARSTTLTFEEYLKQHIFRPANMNATSFLLTDIPLQRRALPHGIGPRLQLGELPIYPYNRIHAPSSTLHSNLNDMLKWAQVWLNKGRIGTTTMITETDWNDMLQPRLKIDDTRSVCLSWFTTQVAGKTIYFHSGGDDGFRSFIGFEPTSRMAIVLMGNNDLFDGAKVGFALCNAILSTEPLQLPAKPISMLLKDSFLTKGIAHAKQLYHQQKQQQPTQYNYEAASVLKLADWLYDNSFKKEAIDVLLFCTELEPHNHRWYELLGDVYLHIGNKQEARRWFQQALQRSPGKEGLQKKLSEVSQ